MMDEQRLYVLKAHGELFAGGVTSEEEGYSILYPNAPATGGQVTPCLCLGPKQIYPNLEELAYDLSTGRFNYKITGNIAVDEETRAILESLVNKRTFGLGTRMSGKIPDIFVSENYKVRYDSLSPDEEKRLFGSIRLY